MEGTSQQQDTGLPSPKRFKYVHNPSASSTFSPANLVLLPSTSMTPLPQPTPSSLPSNNIISSPLQNKGIAPFSSAANISNATTTIPSILPNHTALLSLAANAAQTQQFNLLSNGIPFKKLSKGCSCKKSTCIKGYCECFNNGLEMGFTIFFEIICCNKFFETLGQYCSKNCKCTSCKNYVNSVELKKVREKTISQQNADSVQVLAPPQPAPLPNHILNLQILNSNQQKLGSIPLQQQHQVFIDLNRNHGREVMKAMLTSDFTNFVARQLMNTAIATKEELIKRGDKSTYQTPSSPITPTASSSSTHGDKSLAMSNREDQQKTPTTFDNTISLECEEDDALDSTKPVNNDTKFASVPITPPPQAFDSSIFFTSPTREFLSPPRSKPTTNEAPFISLPVPEVATGIKISEADLQTTIQQAVLQDFKSILDKILEAVKEQQYPSLLHHGAK